MPTRFGPREDVPEDALVVLVHDAARPLLDDVVIGHLLAPLADGFDGVVPVVPITDTVKRVEGAWLWRRSTATGSSLFKRRRPFWHLPGARSQAISLRSDRLRFARRASRGVG